MEDDFVLAQTIRVALTVAGHQVEIAGDGEKALALLETGDRDLVITDFKLPKMDGLELAQAIKERVPSCPIVLITAYAEAVLAAGKVTNVDYLLGKPFSMGQMHGALTKIFPGSSA